MTTNSASDFRILFARLFEPLRHEDEEVIWYEPFEEEWPPSRLERRFDTAGALHLTEGSVVVGGCLHCRPAPCVEYLAHEYQTAPPDIPNDRPAKVCPTDAIVLAEDGAPNVDVARCVFCQICVIRCPVGALYWQGEELKLNQPDRARFNERRDTRREAETGTREWQERLRASTRVVWSVPPDWAENAIGAFHERVNTLARKKEAYYVLARNLFRELGIKASLGRSGDTQWRFDLLTTTPFVMPVELKSPGETLAITPAAARQAVENAAIVESRFKLAVNPISAVVGYQLPNKRSDVREALVDVHTSFGVSVGLYTIGTLFYLLLRHLEYRFHPQQDIEFLFRQNRGPCDENVLRNFWADYMKRRLEVVALERVVSIATLPEQWFPGGLDPALATGDALMQRWGDEVNLLYRLSPVLFPVK